MGNKLNCKSKFTRMWLQINILQKHNTLNVCMKLTLAT